jgi:hypothetical protein
MNFGPEQAAMRFGRHLMAGAGFIAFERIFIQI